MISLDMIKQELIDAGKDPNDYNIKIYESGYSVSPKQFTQYKELVKAVSNPIAENLSITGYEIAFLKLANIQKDNIIDALGQELTKLKLQIMMGGGA